MEATTFTSPSVEEVRNLVLASREEVLRIQSQAVQNATEQEPDGEGRLRELWEDSEVTNGRDDFLENTQNAGEQFLDVCDEVLGVLNAMAAETDEVIERAQQTGAPDAHHMASDALQGSALQAGIQEVAERYAPSLYDSRLSFDAAWETVSAEFASQLEAFKEVVSRRSGVAGDVLDSVVGAVQAMGPVQGPIAVAALGMATANMGALLFADTVSPALALASGLCALELAVTGLVDQTARFWSA
ncbi:hypothetical protein AB0N09_39800 [Streptomyces erythrochromogenes]|uniref:hypothetical protein n=1 Tax=Streptomyces erythrochromogenes TaxID=285574 RepID=UPI00341C5165